MKLNLIDRALLAVDPARAQKRVQARMQAEILASMPSPAVALDAVSDVQTGQSGGGMVRRLFGRAVRDARTDTLPYLAGERAASRHLARTNPVACSAINSNVNLIIGTGLALSAEPARHVLGWTPEQATAWKLRTQREFSLWADSPRCDWSGQNNLYELQQVALRGTKESGDIFTILPDAKRTSVVQPYRLRVQLVEADRVGNPGGQPDSATVAGGVRFEDGAPEAFFVYDQHPGSLAARTASALFKGTWFEREGASGRTRILHFFRMLRPDQPRGVPYLAPIIGLLEQLGRYTEAEIMAAVVSAYYTVFITTDPDVDPSTLVGEEVADQKLALDVGAVVPLAHGEDVTIANPARPNPNYDPFVQAIFLQAGMALGLPYEVLVKKYQSSFSAAKASRLDCWSYIRTERIAFGRGWCQPIYETWLAEAVATGRISAPGFFTDPLMRWAYCRAAWHGDSMGSISPKDEIAAYLAAIDGRIMTRERAEWEIGGTDFNETIEQKAAEQDLLDKHGLLPAPKAGAAAPAQPGRSQPSKPDEEDDK